jgi:hypothetical protein
VVVHPAKDIQCRPHHLLDIELVGVEHDECPRPSADHVFKQENSVG